MIKKNSVLINSKIKKFNKILKIPADKSLSLRALMLASQCIGVSKIKNLLESEDVLSCLKALKTLGVKILKRNTVSFVSGVEMIMIVSRTTYWYNMSRYEITFCFKNWIILRFFPNNLTIEIELDELIVSDDY